MLQHQIVQSPARLGLSNPTSPALQNPTPPKFPTAAAAAAASASSTSHPQPTPAPSSALLPLLPPLPRAQTLLSQMASLSSKLFEASPNRSLFLSSFRGSLPTFLPSSTGPTPDPAPAAASTKEILALATSLQTQLFESVAELQEILDLQDASSRLARDAKGKDSSVLAFAHKLKEAERVLDILVDDYEDYRPPKRAKPSFGDEEDGDADGEEGREGTTTLSSRIKLSDVLSYAHKISYTTFAPPEFGAGVGPLRGALPPAPQDEQMRASQLYAFADLDVGLPKMAEGKERTVEAIVEPPPPPIPMLQQPAEGSLSGLLPPNIMVPSGWKPGMPVELPMDLPVPPPGWKPGDPLPPLESIAMPKMHEQQFPQPAALLKPPEPIQVRHVQLDILDQDDDSSDYSSDEGSSDDDD